MQMELKYQRRPPLPIKKSQNPSPPIVLPAIKPKQQLNHQALQSNSTEKVRRNYRMSVQRRPISAKSQQRDRLSVQSRKSRVRESSRDSRKSNASKSGSKSKNRMSPHYNIRLRMSQPTISAKSWAIYEMKEAKLIQGQKTFKKREIASLTKMMNLITILEILQKDQLIAKNIRFNVAREASATIGTTASLKSNIQVSLQDLFFGMMLPSGNDAAVQIALIGGSLLAMKREYGQIQKEIVYSSYGMTSFYQSIENSQWIYVQQMNRLSKSIGMMRSNWANPHGLSNTTNVSTVEDIAKLVIYAMKNADFRSIVCTQKYVCQFFYYPQELEEGVQSQIESSLGSQIKRSVKTGRIEKGVLSWQNTNRLLQQKWNGVKTGVTPNAGPCLAASISKYSNGRELQFLVILIDSITMDSRWKEAKALVDWVISENICSKI